MRSEYKKRWDERQRRQKELYLRSFGIEPTLPRGVVLIGPTWRAYAAGLIDGEGCILITRKIRPQEQRNPSYTPTLIVNMVKPDAIRRLQALYGGRIDVKDNKKKNANSSFMWYVHGDNLRRLLSEVLPYLLLKAPQAEAALIVLASTKANPRRKALTPQVMKERNALVDFVKKMNRRGRYVA